MHLCPGNFVVLESLTAEMLVDSIHLTEVPGPAYDMRLCGSVRKNELCLVISTAMVTHAGEPVLEDLYARILTPTGAVGWIHSDYLEIISVR